MARGLTVCATWGGSGNSNHNRFERFTFSKPPALPEVMTSWGYFSARPQRQGPKTRPFTFTLNRNGGRIRCRASLDIALRGGQGRLVGFCDSDEKP